MSAIRPHLAHAWHALERRAAHAFVAGPTLDDALAAAIPARANGLAVTLCFWNDERDAPPLVFERYLEAQAALTRQPGCYLSAKAPALGFDEQLVERLARRGAELSVPLHFDALDVNAADGMLAVAERAHASGASVGVTLPGRWRRSEADVERAANFANRVRVVKGEWADPGDQRRDRRRGFLAVVDRLAGTGATVALASHDGPLLDEAVRRLHGRGTTIELELLYGYPRRRALAVARRWGIPMRLYVPYGRAWLPWTLDELRRRPWLSGRLLKAALRPAPARTSRLEA